MELRSGGYRAPSLSIRVGRGCSSRSAHVALQSALSFPERLALLYAMEGLRSSSRVFVFTVGALDRRRSFERLPCWRSASYKQRRLAAEPPTPRTFSVVLVGPKLPAIRWMVEHFRSTGAVATGIRPHWPGGSALAAPKTPAIFRSSGWLRSRGWPTSSSTVRFTK